MTPNKENLENFPDNHNSDQQFPPNRELQAGSEKLEIIQNYTAYQLANPKDQSKNAPTNGAPKRKRLFPIKPEDLEKPSPSDPRFKSPDDFLKQLSAAKPGPLPSSAEETSPAEPKGISLHYQPLPFLKEPEKDQAPKHNGVESNLHVPEAHLDAMPDGKTRFPESASDDHAELLALKKKHRDETLQWKEYAQNVKHWQAQMMGLIQQLKKEKAGHCHHESEIQSLKEQIRMKDQELFKQKNNGSKLTDWLKGFRKKSR